MGYRYIRTYIKVYDLIDHNKYDYLKDEELYE